MTALRRTPLHDLHVRLGARMVPFAGFSMPVQYGGIVEEHRAVRERAGLFDVSHMGQIHLSGTEAVAAGDRLLSRRVSTLRPGRVRYALLCNERGGVVDDVTAYRTGEDALFLCVNAANIEKDYRWVVRHAPEAAGVRDRSDETALLALQGPESAAVLSKLAGDGPAALRRFRFDERSVAGARALVSRTGYTGSDGFEIYLAAADAAAVFESLLEAGASHGLVPAGLGARDTLRLEAALPLYGHELDDESSPLDAGLGRFVDLDAGGFIGAEAIAERSRAGAERALVGFVLEDRGVPRAGYAVSIGGSEVGRVTSGGHSPTLGQSIGLAWVPTGASTVGGRIDVMIRGKGVAARIVETPFVKAAS